MNSKTTGNARGAAPVAPHDYREARTLLLDSQLARAELLTCAGLGRTPTPEIFSPHAQFLVTLRGCFLWHVGASRHLVDANRCVLIHAGEASQDSHPSESGEVHALLVTPASELIAELFRWDGGSTASSGEFRAHTIHASPRFQLAASAFVAGASDPARREPLALEEAILGVLRRLRPTGRAHAAAVSPRVRQLVRTVKERLQTMDSRASLGEIARAVNVTAAHLTHTFRRVEGVPLAVYHRRIRLARALYELPRTENLATLALDLGFSSHGHFSAAFKSLYGITPSEFRDRPMRRMVASYRAG